MTLPRYDDAMRRLAHDVIDRLFDHVATIEQRPVLQYKTSDELRGILEKTDDPVGTLLEYANQLHHPMYIGHQVCPPFPTAVIADLLISTLNQSTAVWEMSPVATVIEKEIVRWLTARARYPETSLGTAVSGGSAANLTALLAARARWIEKHGASGKRPLVICSADAHYSIARAAAIMGVASHDVIQVPTDDRHRMDVAALDELLAATDSDRLLAIVATSGSTSTGAFDELQFIAELRDRWDTWLHVDAAHGASALLSRSLHHLVLGIERADSLSWDPHKMMWMPLSLGIVLVRDGNWLRRAFSADAPYLFHAERAGDNIGEVTIQCSKRADAVKLWLTLRLLGEEVFAEALERVTEVTRHLYDCVEASKDFEAMHVPEMNIFCFRWRAGDDSKNQEIREKLMQRGEAWITTTMLKGRRVLRVTVINPATTNEHVERLLDSIRRIAT
jgi:L-2,4-diaminobutyrate decarboxylase